jgi:predicted GIY-YIG superfamily endonuclease
MFSGMKQMLLFPDPRPLVERFGADFFRQAPQNAGVYLMRDRAEAVLYVGKAKNLRKRLASYRVANPERMPRRRLRLLRAVARIEFQQCADEASALARESELLLSLRPRFNRAGTWRAEPRFLAWRVTGEALELAITRDQRPDWHSHGPMGAGATHIRAPLVRLLWCALHPQRGLGRMPEGWFCGRLGEVATIPLNAAGAPKLELAAALLAEFFAGHADRLITWIQECTSMLHPFDLTVRQEDLQTLSDYARRGIRRVELNTNPNSPKSGQKHMQNASHE